MRKKLFGIVAALVAGLSISASAEDDFLYLKCDFVGKTRHGMETDKRSRLFQIDVKNRKAVNSYNGEEYRVEVLTPLFIKLSSVSKKKPCGIDGYEFLIDRNTGSVTEHVVLLVGPIMVPGCPTDPQDYLAEHGETLGLGDRSFDSGTGMCAKAPPVPQPKF
jgi:hypothetical protein